MYILAYLCLISTSTTKSSKMYIMAYLSIYVDKYHKE